MSFWDGISILAFLITLVLLIIGIVFLFMKNGKANKIFKLLGIVFAVAIGSLILSGDNGFWYSTFILAFLATVILLIVGIVYLFMKNGKAKKVFKTSGIVFAVTIVSFILTIAFADNTATQTASNTTQKEEPNQDVKAEEAKKEAEAKKAEEAKKEAEAKKAEEAKKEAEAKKKAEEAKKEAEAKKAEEAKKEAEAKKKAEEAKKEAEAKKKAEEAKKEAEAKKKAEEAEKISEVTEKNQTIFDNDWETFKSNWYNSMNSVDGNISVIRDLEEEQSGFNIRHDGQLRKSLFISANTDENTDKIVYAVVIGAIVENNTDINGLVLLASTNLIKITDPSLTLEKRKQIALEYLGLGDGVILYEKSLSYSHNGITYLAEYEHGEGSVGTLLVSVEKE
ncbi:hypothetical protein BAOM_1396 [Peribacillus asahii]|uniref:Uncharacterized protein n=1 Tax=Peribacillus asahii TaxID=228899 RepID=A0A3Q9RKZ1_9BACI|nr:mitofilin family membrane protein [Peribacillus asahii]AZV42006.1 hypothetical protein BAOM_1396 [Peribacillus asahii]